MEGITILASEVVMTVHPLFWNFFFIGFVSLILAYSIYSSPKQNRGTHLAFILFIISTIIGFSGAIWAGVNKVEDYVKYDIIISENVAFQEFYNKYEILDVKGQFYTVKEIELDD